MGEAVVVFVHHGTLFSHEKEEILPFVTSGGPWWHYAK